MKTSFVFNDLITYNMFPPGIYFLIKSLKYCLRIHIILSSYLIDNRRQNVTMYLYHYTDEDSLEWIFKSRSIKQSRRERKLIWFFKARYHIRVQPAFTACCCVIKETVLACPNQRSYFENATACSKLTLKVRVETLL